MERLDLGFEVKFAQGAPDGTFEGYGSIFDNEDGAGDVIRKGAFRDTLKDWKAKGKLPKMLLQHGGFWSGVEDMIPIGKWTAMEEDSKGLRVEGRLISLDTDRGKSIYSAMREGELDGLSIGYLAKKFTMGTKPSEPYRSLEAVELKEVSVVLFGANSKALIESVKSEDIDAIYSLSEAERFLREAGRFDRKTATAFVSRLKRLSQREAAGEQDTVALLKRAASLIKP